MTAKKCTKTQNTRVEQLFCGVLVAVAVVVAKAPYYCQSGSYFNVVRMIFATCGASYFVS